MEKICKKCEERFDAFDDSQLYCPVCRKNLKCKYDGCNCYVRYPSLMLCASHYSQENRRRTVRKCKKCNEDFEISNGRQLYCEKCMKKVERIKKCPIFIKVCEICNKGYIGKRSNQKYCNECKEESLKNNLDNSIKRRRKTYIKICCNCNKNFETTRNFQKCCDEECRKEYEKIKKKEYYQDVIKPLYKYENRGSSYPQKFIFQVIKENFEDMLWEYDDRSVLHNPETNYAMEIDIWNKENKIAIEYDGEHHFSPKQYGEEIFKYVKKLDNIKNNLCKEKGIKLLRIGYKDNWRDKSWIIEKVGELINVNN